jgi:hypothetical protein
LVFDQSIGYIKYLSRIAHAYAGRLSTLSPLSTAKPALCEPMPNGWTHQDAAARLVARLRSMVIDVLFVSMVVLVKLGGLLIRSFDRANKGTMLEKSHRKG